MRSAIKYSAFFALIFSIFLLVILWLIFSGPSNKPTKKCTLFFDNYIVLHNIPLAETKAQQTQGLAGDHVVYPGMLFIMAKPKQLVFWMKNTKMPLSIGFFTKNGDFFQIEDMLPETETYHISKSTGVGALELPLGKFSQLGLSVGSKLMNYECTLIKDSR